MSNHTLELQNPDCHDFFAGAEKVVDGMSLEKVKSLAVTTMGAYIMLASFKAEGRLTDEGKPRFELLQKLVETAGVAGTVTVTMVPREKGEQDHE